MFECIRLLLEVCFMSILNSSPPYCFFLVHFQMILFNCSLSVLFTFLFYVKKCLENKKYFNCQLVKLTLHLILLRILLTEHQCGCFLLKMCTFYVFYISYYKDDITFR